MSININGSGGRIILIAVACGLCLSAARATENYLVRTDGLRLEAQSIRYQASTREYIVVAERGTFPIPETQVREVRVSKPPRWDQAERLLRAGQHDEAIGIFREIVRDYNRLNWDNNARGMLAEAYAAKGEHTRAIVAYEEMFRTVAPSARQRRGYWQSLLAAERFGVLKRELDRVIAEGSREEAAYAQLMRGHVHVAEGNPMEALFDYLRTHILFEDVREVQPEALYRAAERLDALRDGARADELRRTLRQRYPNSEFARRTR